MSLMSEASAVSDILLRPQDRALVRSLLTLEPIPGSPLPSREFLLTLEKLIPCDGLLVALADNEGRSLDRVHADGHPFDPGDAMSSGGPFNLGIIHWVESREQVTACMPAFKQGDGVWVGFRNGPDHVVQLVMWRKTRPYSDRELALLDMLAPHLRRLMRERLTPQLPATLTVQERRVLMHVAAGRSNPEIAEELCIASATVRKHLEHAFRKLGVSSRLAAVAALQGRHLTNLDLKERIERFDPEHRIPLG